MSRTLTRLFSSLDDAKAAVADLEAFGIPRSEISIVSGHKDDPRGADHHQHLGDHDPIIDREASKGAAVGAGVGGVAGVIAGLMLLTVPGLGPVFAVGWLVTTIGATAGGAALGAATGGLVATLTRHGVEEYDAEVYTEGVRRGDTLVSARMDDKHYERAVEALQTMKARDAATVAETYRAEGWAPEPAALDEEPVTAEDVARERETPIV